MKDSFRSRTSPADNHNYRWEEMYSGLTVLNPGCSVSEGLAVLLGDGAMKQH